MTPPIPNLEDTIVALSSAAGPGALGIVRLSGRRAASIVGSLCSEFNKERQPRGILFQATLRLPNLHGVLSADVYFFASPHTLTGQDIVELHVVSCPPLVDLLIAVCLNAGARAAQPGEFTLRAFLAGKLDLTRAEAVLGVIEASDQNELQQALLQLAGGVEQPLRALREDLLNLLADVEAGLDFADEDIHFIAGDDLLKRLGSGLAHLTLLKKQLQRRALSQRPFRVVLTGCTNAGKSSLFNALAGMDAALVSPEPGTTRDYLEKTLNVDGRALTLVDTAGLGTNACAIESAAQDLGTHQTRQADLVVWCTPCDEIASADAIPVSALRVATKADLAAPPANILSTSVASGAGLPELRARLAAEMRRAGHASLAPSVSRCSHHVDACLQHLRNGHAIVIEEGMAELLALEVRLALDELGAMVGAIYTEDLLDRVFSRFCIGK